MISQEDNDIICQQLGREPRGMIEVAYRRNGIPCVLKMRPVVGGKPFPTIYWLSSKDLYLALSKIETQGWVKRLETELKADQIFMQAYLDDQQHYQRERLALLNEEETQQLKKLGIDESFVRLGVGGLRDLHQVRCLHMHYAYHLVTPNTLGKYLDCRFPELASMVVAQ